MDELTAKLDTLARDQEVSEGVGAGDRFLPPSRATPPHYPSEKTGRAPTPWYAGHARDPEAASAANEDGVAALAAGDAARRARRLHRRVGQPRRRSRPTPPTVQRPR